MDAFLNNFEFITFYALLHAPHYPRDTSRVLHLADDVGSNILDALRNESCTALWERHQTSVFVLLDALTQPAAMTHATN